MPTICFLRSRPGETARNVRLGSLRITDGQAHVLLARPRADLNVAIETRDNDNTPQLVAEAKGTYAAQPVNANFVGGSLLSLRDAATAYPVDLKVASGPTHARLVGTVQDPQKLAGADLKLELAGTDMQLLLPLIGIAFPKTPSYQIKGDLDYADGKIRFRNFTGQLGSSDIEGNIEVDPGQKRPVVTADVASRQIDLADLGGFLGSEPGRMNTPNQTPEQHQAVARAEASPRLLPTTTISLPKLLAADVHLKYRGARIQGRNMPFDSLAADMDIVDGRILLHPVSIGVGQGQITGTVELAPVNGEQFRTKADIAVQRVDLGRMLKATNMVSGSGVIGGHAVLDTTGNSTATMLANGNGSLQLTMAGGGDLSALLVALSGLQFGNALLSALGIPDRDKIECFVADFVLQRGELQTRALLLDTTSDITSGSGTINLRAETLNYEIKTEAKHFTIGALPAPISITGSFKDPGALPDITEARRPRRGSGRPGGVVSASSHPARRFNSAWVTIIGARRWRTAANSRQRAVQPSTPAPAVTVGATSLALCAVRRHTVTASRNEVTQWSAPIDLCRAWSPRMLSPGGHRPTRMRSLRQSPSNPPHQIAQLGRSARYLQIQYAHHGDTLRVEARNARPGNRITRYHTSIQCMLLQKLCEHSRCRLVERPTSADAHDGSRRAPFRRPLVLRRKRQIRCRLFWQALFGARRTDDVLFGLARAGIRIRMIIQTLDQIVDGIPDAVEL